MDSSFSIVTAYRLVSIVAVSLLSMWPFPSVEEGMGEYGTCSVVAIDTPMLGRNQASYVSVKRRELPIEPPRHERRVTS